VFIEAVVGVIILAFLLYRRPHSDIVQWLVACILMFVLAEIFAQVGHAVYQDPRPFTVDHVKPLFAHAPDNGFPSDHAMLAALVVGAVAFISVWWALPLAVFAVLVDWARVGAGIHHVADVAGSSLFVAAAALVAFLVAPAVARLLLPMLPPSLTVEQRRLRGVPRYRDEPAFDVLESLSEARSGRRSGR
jgi:undecaprenyl-diphosphatase